MRLRRHKMIPWIDSKRDHSTTTHVTHSYAFPNSCVDWKLSHGGSTSGLLFMFDMQKLMDLDRQRHMLAVPILP